MADRKDTTVTYVAGWILMSLVLFGVGYIIWYYNKYEIMNAIRYIRWVQLYPVSWVMGTDYIVTNDTAGNPMSLGQLMIIAHDTQTRMLSPELIGAISTLTMGFYRVVFSCVLILMGLWAMFYGPTTQYRKRYDIHGLIRKQSEAFPYVSPLVDFDPGKQPFRAPGASVPAELPPFAEALAPEEWIAYYTIPTLTDRNIDRAAATKAFSRQLGRPWRGWKHLKPYRQVLLAAFCLKGARKRKEADLMIGELAQCWSKGSLNLSGKLLRDARAVLRNEKLSGKTLGKCAQHAFETTALIRALATAREEGGIFAPATFVWLRAHDRTLWYPLNNLGRQAYHMEALGAMCHYKAEKLAQRPIVRPKVEGAVESLAEYMKSYRARPVPQVDYSRSKRSSIKKATSAKRA